MKFHYNVLMNKAGDGDGGGSGSGNGAGTDGDQGKNSNQNQNQNQNSNTVTMSKADHDAIMARLAKLEGKGSGDGGGDQDLLDKARKDREAADKKTGDTKALEDALRFEMGAEAWLKTNQALLPKDVEDVFKAAKSEKYDSAVEKDSAIKAGIIKSFFTVQANLDLLTPGLKNQLEDYLKLTNTGRQEKARHVYDTIFEPAFEMLKRVKKAEALQKGHGDGSDDSYKTRLMQGSRKHYLGEKNA